MRELLKSIFNFFDLNLQRKSLVQQSDDPIHALSLLFSHNTLKTIIDGGASIGSIAQRLSNIFPQSIVHAFEPYLPHFEVLQKVAKTNNHIVPIQKGLSERNEIRTFYLNQASGSNSLLQASEQGQAVYGEQLQEIGQTEIECISLDCYLQQNEIESVDLLKLDLQGGEVAALQGASQILQAGKIKCILCEVMFDRHYVEQPTAGTLLHILVEKYGFTLFNLYQLHHHHGRLIYADALLVHSSILPYVEARTVYSFHPHAVFPLK